MALMMLLKMNTKNDHESLDSKNVDLSYLPALISAQFL